jgi:hypothetical protein
VLGDGGSSNNNNQHNPNPSPHDNTGLSSSSQPALPDGVGNGEVENMDDEGDGIDLR